MLGVLGVSWVFSELSLFSPSRVVVVFEPEENLSLNLKRFFFFSAPRGAMFAGCVAASMRWFGLPRDRQDWCGKLTTAPS